MEGRGFRVQGAEWRMGVPHSGGRMRTERGPAPQGMHMVRKGHGRVAAGVNFDSVHVVDFLV